MKHRPFFAAAALLAAAGAFAQAGDERGALLYENHCAACHTTKIHWRDQKAAVDWPGLQAQVRRWQGEAQLNWSDEDIDAVARHLNARFYRFEISRGALNSIGLPKPQ
jgi:cytochrome c1